MFQVANKSLRFVQTFLPPQSTLLFSTLSLLLFFFRDSNNLYSKELGYKWHIASERMSVSPLTVSHHTIANKVLVLCMESKHGNAKPYI